MSEWKTFKLGEIAHVQTGPFGSQLHQKDYVSIGTPIITVEHLGENRITHVNLPRVSNFDKERLKKYILKKGDIVFSRVGSVDRRAIVHDGEDGWLFSGRCLRVRVDESIINSIYLSYYFGLESFRSEIRMIAVGTTMPSLNTQILSNLDIPIPSLITQHRIASILSSLDDKIELNRQTNQTLEHIAQTLFKEMCLPKGDELPEGWRVGKLGEIMEIKGGTTPSTSIKEYWDGEYYWATPKDLSNLNTPILINTNRKISALGVKQISSGVLPVGTLLLSSRAPIGYLAISKVPVSINQGFIAINGKSVSNLFILYWIKSNIETLLNYANGSTFLEISKSVFRNIDITIPDNAALNKFDRQTANIFEMIYLNELETQTLTTLRNSLLPKLMKGEIEV